MPPWAKSKSDLVRSQSISGSALTAPPKDIVAYAPVVLFIVVVLEMSQVTPLSTAVGEVLPNVGQGAVVVSASHLAPKVYVMF